MLLRLRQLCNHPCLIQENGESKRVMDGFDGSRSAGDKDELSRAAKLLSPNFVARIKHQRKELALARMAAEQKVRLSASFCVPSCLKDF